jgi:hypothetical protein
MRIMGKAAAKVTTHPNRLTTTQLTEGVRIMAKADSTVTIPCEKILEIFDRVHKLRALAMSADALLCDEIESDKTMAVSHVLSILTKEAEDVAEMHSILLNKESERAHA